MQHAIMDDRTLHVTCGNSEPFASLLVRRSTSQIDEDPQGENEKNEYYVWFGPPNVDHAFDGASEALDRHPDGLSWNRVGIACGPLQAPG